MKRCMWLSIQVARQQGTWWGSDSVARVNCGFRCNPDIWQQHAAVCGSMLLLIALPCMPSK